NCQWDFGDGSAPAYGCTLTHAWKEPGDYVLTLTVSDGARTHSRSAAVRAEAATVTPPPTPTPTATPALSHDSSVRAPRRVRIRIRPGRAAATARVVLRLANADVSPVREQPGHAI